jgi:hypothetical protein
VGTCQPLTITPRIRVDTNGERPDSSSPGSAKARRSGSSPIGPSPGFARRTANTMRMAFAELNVTIEGMPWLEGDVGPRGGHGDGKPESYAHRVRVPPHAPADLPQAKLSRPPA